MEEKKATKHINSTSTTSSSLTSTSSQSTSSGPLGTLESFFKGFWPWGQSEEKKKRHKHKQAKKKRHKVSSKEKFSYSLPSTFKSKSTSIHDIYSHLTISTARDENNTLNGIQLWKYITQMKIIKYIKRRNTFILPLNKINIGIFQELSALTLTNNNFNNNNEITTSSSTSSQDTSDDTDDDDEEEEQQQQEEEAEFSRTFSQDLLQQQRKESLLLQRIQTSFSNFQQLISTSTASWPPNVTQDFFLDQMSSTCLELLNADVVSIFIFDWRQKCFVRQATSSIIPFGRSGKKRKREDNKLYDEINDQRDILNFVARTNLPVNISSPEQMPHLTTSNDENSNNFFIFAPILFDPDGSVQGVIEGRRNTKPFSDIDLSWLTVVSRITGQGLLSHSNYTDACEELKQQLELTTKWLGVFTEEINPSDIVNIAVTAFSALVPISYIFIFEPSIVSPDQFVCTGSNISSSISHTISSRKGLISNVYKSGKSEHTQTECKYSSCLGKQSSISEFAKSLTTKKEARMHHPNGFVYPVNDHFSSTDNRADESPRSTPSPTSISPLTPSPDSGANWDDDLSENKEEYLSVRKRSNSSTNISKDKKNMDISRRLSSTMVEGKRSSNGGATTSKSASYFKENIASASFSPFNRRRKKPVQKPPVQQKKVKKVDLLVLPMNDCKGKPLAIVQFVERKEPNLDTGYCFTPRDIAILSAMACQTGEALEKASLTKALEYERKKSHAISEILRLDLQQSHLTHTELISVIVASAYDMLNPERIGVFFVDRGRGDLLCISSPDIQGVRIKIGKGIVGTVAKTGAGLNVPIANEHPDWDNKYDLRTGHTTISLLSVPVKDINGLCIAVLQAVNKKWYPNGPNGDKVIIPFTSQDASMLQAYCLGIGGILRRHVHNALIEKLEEYDQEHVNSMLALYGGIAGKGTIKDSSFKKKFNKRNNSIGSLKQGSLHTNLFTLSSPTIGPATGESFTISTSNTDVFAPLREEEEFQQQQQEEEEKMEWPIIEMTKRCDIEYISSNEFNVWLYTEDELLYLLMIMIEDLGFIEEYKLDILLLKKFLLAIQYNYGSSDSIAYHSWVHAFSVTQVGYYFLKNTELGITELLYQFAFFFSCLMHDLDHPGYNNNFECNTNNRHARKYHDQSALENHHIEIALQLLTHESINFLNMLSEEDQSVFRTYLIEGILATDMNGHIPLMADLEKERRYFSPDLIKETLLNDDKKRLFFFNICIHLADLLCIAYPTEVAVNWERRVSSEFYAQYLREDRLGIQTTSLFKDLPSVAFRGQNQVVFIDYVLMPFISTMIELLPQLAKPSEHLSINREYFERVGYGELDLEPLIDVEPWCKTEMEEAYDAAIQTEYDAGMEAQSDDDIVLDRSYISIQSDESVMIQSDESVSPPPFSFDEETISVPPINDFQL